MPKIRKPLPKVVALVGPTASGKTALAIALAKKFRGKLISIDSRQLYKEMDIGTAKDRSYPQHLIDILSPKKTFNISSFKNRALRVIREILRGGKLPILVGGSGLYFSAIVNNLQIPKIKPDELLRNRLEKLPIRELENKLFALDPAAAKIALKNKRRIIRALEVIEKTGHYFSAQRERGKSLFNTLIIGLRIPREKLSERIDKRIDEQIKNGLVKEVAVLVKKYGEKAYALQNTIAYKELLPYLRGEITLAEAALEIKKNSRRFAKRQITWFKMQPDVHWLNSEKEAIRLIKKFLE